MDKEWFDYVRWEVVVMILVALGIVTVTSLFWIHRVQKWRMRWIYLEHETARELNREPRNISMFYSADYDPDVPLPPPPPKPPLSSHRREDGGMGTCPDCQSTLINAPDKAGMLCCNQYPECPFIISKELYARTNR